MSEGNQVTIQRAISDMVDEYNYKLENLENALEEFKKAGSAIKMAACVNGVFGQENINVGSIYLETLKRNLKKSA